jgi:hypothetical protein
MEWLVIIVFVIFIGGIGIVIRDVLRHGSSRNI